MADSNSFFGSIRDSATISKWCHDYGTVNNQPEIVRAGKLIDILFERICHDANLIGEYSDDADKMFERLKKEKEIFNGIIEEMQAAGLSREKLDVQVGLAKRNCDLREQINMIDHERHLLEEKLRECNEKIEEMHNTIRLALISSRSV